MHEIRSKPKKFFSLSSFVALITLAAICFTPASAGYRPTAGAVSGMVMYYGSQPAGEKIIVGYYLTLNQGPEETTNIESPGGDYMLTDIEPGDYYIFAQMDLNLSGGPPNPGEPVGFYDFNHDGDPDTVTVGDGLVTGIDIAMNQSTVNETTTAPIIYYVDDTAAGLNNGTSWVNAYTSLQSALTSASIAGTEIWVAAGTYKPTTTTTRTIAFALKNNIAIYGGFAGSETFRHQRDKSANETILSGDIGTIGTWTDNSYHVVTGNSTDGTAVLSDVTIKDGRADAGGDADKGGGILITAGSPTISNVRFLHNYGYNHGGGIAIQVTTTNPTRVINCTFSGNSSNANGAGIAVFNGAKATIVNSTFTGNNAPAGALTVFTAGTVVTARNIILYGNTSQQIESQDAAASTNVTYSIIQGGCPADAGLTCANIINSNPLFVDDNGVDNTFGTMDDDLRLLWTSPAVDAGDNAAVFADNMDLDGDGDFTELAPLDMDLALRFEDFPGADAGLGTPPIVDIGAYEILPWKIFLPAVLH